MRIAAVVFDLYGTVLSIEGMDAFVAAAGISDAPAFVRDWRRKQIEYSWLVTMGGAYRNFDEITALALEYTLAQHQVTLDAAAQQRLAEDIRAMPPHPDAFHVLHRLRSDALPLAILTNGTSSSANAAVAAAGLDHIFDDVLSVETAGVFKPNPRCYEIATARFSCTPSEIIFVSSNAWDAWGAAQFGFRVAWCNRSGGPVETLAPVPEFHLRSLDELEAIVLANK